MVAPRILSFSLVGILLVIAGCSTSTDDDRASGGATIVSFAATPDVIDAGGNATLRWDVGGAVSVGLADESGAAIELGPAAHEARQVDVSPLVTTRYTLSATGKDGSVVTGQARVSVRPGAPRILSFVAAPTSVVAGEAVSLAWTTENAASVRIFAKDGSEVALAGASPAGGSVSVTPDRSTSFTLRATGATASVEQSVGVTVVGALDVELFADRSRIDAGQGTTLRWRSRSAERIVLRVGEEVLLDTDTQLSGSLPVTPDATTVFVVDAHGDGKVVTASTTVAVAPVVSSFEAATPGSHARGADVELRWSVRGAQAVRITGSDGWTFDAGAEALEDGSTIAAVPDDGRFELEAVLAGEKTVRFLKLALLDPPAVLAFGATPGVVTVPAGGQASVTLTWNTARATSVDVELEGGGVVFTSGDSVGTTEVDLDRDTTFVLVARNAAGEARRSAAVRAVAPPAIDGFAARPIHVGIGESFELSWSTRAATRVVVQRDGQEIHRGTGGDGSIATQLAAAATFHLRAENAAGASVERTVRVTTGLPAILSFTADRARHGPGSTVLFSWTALGGTSLTLKDPAGAPVSGCTTTDLDRIPAGDCTVLLTGSLGPRRYTLELANGLGQTDVEAIDLEVVDGPAIVEFYADRSRATVGEPVLFTWTTTPDGDGHAAALSLADGADVYSLGAAPPASGSASVAPLRAGARTFRLTAATAGTTASARDVSLHVFEAPTLAVTAGSTSYNPDTGPVTIAWESAHAVEITVDEVDGQGASRRIATYVDPVAIAAGQVGVQPPAPGRTYRFVARNGADATVSSEVSVVWTAPEIVDFSATPAEVATRGTSTLQWSTSGASAVTLSPAPMVAGEPYFDVSASATAIELVLGDCGAAVMPEEGCTSAVLPFSFPWDGQPRDQVRVFLHGALGFDLSYLGASSGPVALPSPAKSFVDLAPFWQELRASVPGQARTGKIWFDHGTGPRGRWAAIQWKGFWVAAANSSQQVDLNFEVVLFESGDFDYRYGTMSGASLAAWTDGRHASIGHQRQGGASGRSVLFQQAIEGGLGNFSIGFRSDVLPAGGSFEVLGLFPGASTYTLTASNHAGSETATATVTTHPRVTLTGVQVVDAFPVPNTPFRVKWTATNAAEVRVERPQTDPDDLPVVLCTVLPAQPQQCDLQEGAVGFYDYVVRAVGRGAADEQIAALQVEVLPSFSIDSFGAAPGVVTKGDEVTVTWTTTNADTLTLTANGASVNIASLSKGSDSIAVTVTADTTFVLTATSRGRTLTESASVVANDPPPPPEE